MVGGRVEQLAPGSTELIDQLAARLRAPGVVLAGLAALIGAGVCLAFGLVLAAALPRESLLTIGDGGLFEDTLTQAISFSQANFEFVDATSSWSGRMTPVLFVLIPILGVAAGVAQLAPRTVGLPAKERLLWAAGAGLPFALIMLVLALGVGGSSLGFGAEVKPLPGAVFLLSLVWGSSGGLLGMLVALRRESVRPAELLPPTVGRYGGIAWTALRPLALALGVVAVLGALTWSIHVIGDDSDREFVPRSTPVAVVEQLAYAGDRGIGLVTLGAGASQRLVGAPLVPIGSDRVEDLADFSAEVAPTYNIFSFGGTMPTLLFVPMLLVLMAIPALLALYAGFTVVRFVGETRLERAAAWGATVGPIWALAIVILSTLARKVGIVDPVGDSVFVAFLFGGAVLGALGGVLAVQAAVPSPGSPPLARSHPR